MTKNILKKLAIFIAVGTAIYAFDCFRIAQVQRSAIREIRHVSTCVLGFDNHRVHAIDLNEIFTQDEPRLPMRTWTEAVFGFDLVHRCRSVEILSNELDEALPYLLKLPYLEELSIVTMGDSNDRLSMLEGATELIDRRIERQLPGVNVKFIDWQFNTDLHTDIEDTRRLPREL